MNINELYQQAIIDHSKNPKHFCVLETANHKKEGFNPLCGDKVTIYIEEKENQIHQITFQGCGCAISIASASLMTEMIRGKTKHEFEALFQQFIELVTKGEEGPELKKLNLLSGVSAFPMRVKCATLCWHTAKSALEEKHNA
jgi:nitrogen fixation protein NifU and related proteins